MNNTFSVEVCDSGQELLHVLSTSKLVERGFLSNSVEELTSCAKSTKIDLILHSRKRGLLGDKVVVLFVLEQLKELTNVRMVHAFQNVIFCEEAIIGNDAFLLYFFQSPLYLWNGNS